MVKVAVTGAAGRMGQRIVSLVHEAEGLAVSAALEHHMNRAVGQDAGLVAGCGRLDLPVTADLEAGLEASDVLIDFTWPEVTLENLAACIRIGSGREIFGHAVGDGVRIRRDVGRRDIGLRRRDVVADEPDVVVDELT